MIPVTRLLNPMHTSRLGSQTPPRQVQIHNRVGHPLPLPQNRSACIPVTYVLNVQITVIHVLRQGGPVLTYTLSRPTIRSPGVGKVIHATPGVSAIETAATVNVSVGIATSSVVTFIELSPDGEQEHRIASRKISWILRRDAHLRDIEIVHSRVDSLPGGAGDHAGSVFLAPVIQPCRMRIIKARSSRIKSAGDVHYMQTVLIIVASVEIKHTPLDASAAEIADIVRCGRPVAPINPVITIVYRLNEGNVAQIITAAVTGWSKISESHPLGDRRDHHHRSDTAG